MTTFTREQLATLRKIAQQATQDEWRAFISSDTGTYAVHTPGDKRCDDVIKWPGFDGQKNAENNARYIAAFNPKVVLALLDVLDASLDAKPVALCIVEDGGMCVDGFSEYVGHSLPDGMQELYAAPPASVVPEAKPVAWRYRYVKKGVTDSQGEPWVGDWKYIPTKEDCNDRPNYEIQALFTAPPVPLTPEGLIKAVRFYEQVKRENPPVETGAWKAAVDWVLKEACQAVNIGIKGE